MSRGQSDAIRRRLTDVGDQLRRLREELRVTDEELAHFRAEADDAEVRSIVSDRPDASREDREAKRSVDAISRQRDHLVREIDKLVASQDDLLDELSAAGRDNP